MIYKSNLVAPDLSPNFKLRTPPMQHMGHDVPSDPDFAPDCGFLTHDEVSILFHIAKAWPMRWVDIGARLGWTAAHLIEGGAVVTAIDPELLFQSFLARFETNIAPHWDGIREVQHFTSKEFFSRARYNKLIDAAMIDGCHDAPEPTLDAARAILAGAEVLVWHDFQGKPVRDAMARVLDLCTWKARVYDTPNGMAVAWLDSCGFVPPDHVPDPAIDWAEIRARYRDFDFGRCV